MPATPAQARDQICQLVKDGVASSAYSTLQLIWDDSEQQVPLPSTSQAATGLQPPWARVRVTHTRGRQASLSGAQNIKRWERGGLVVVQLFTGSGDGQRVQDSLISIILGIFEGKVTSGGVWFLNARPNEIGISGGWRQTNVIIEFRYDEIK